MIVVTVGTNPFPRLVSAMDKYAGKLGEVVLMQISRAQFEPQHGQVCDFLPDIQEYFERASVVVTHAGIGTVAEILRVGTPFVMVPRRAHLGEHFDDHQWQFVTVTGPTLPCAIAHEMDELPAAIAEAPARRISVPFESSRPHLIDAVRSIVRDLDLEKRD